MSTLWSLFSISVLFWEVFDVCVTHKFCGFAANHDYLALIHKNYTYNTFCVAVSSIQYVGKEYLVACHIVSRSRHDQIPKCAMALSVKY